MKKLLLLLAITFTLFNCSSEDDSIPCECTRTIYDLGVFVSEQSAPCGTEEGSFNINGSLYYTIKCN